MYFCNECKIYWEDEEGCCCPECGDRSDTYIQTCSQCGNDFECDEFALTICDECREKVYANFEKTLEFAEWEADEDELSETEVNEKKKINTFYTWLFGVDTVNNILKQYAKEHIDVSDIQSFWRASDNLTVDDFLKKEFDI